MVGTAATVAACKPASSSGTESVSEENMVRIETSMIGYICKCNTITKSRMEFQEIPRDEDLDKRASLRCYPDGAIRQFRKSDATKNPKRERRGEIYKEGKRAEFQDFNLGNRYFPDCRPLSAFIPGLVRHGDKTFQCIVDSWGCK
jgi:hypothetical protein